VRAIGWLERGSPFPTGNTDRALLRMLEAHTAPGRWMPFVSPGVHFCDLGCKRAGGTGFIVIPSSTCVYVAPDLVGHYVEVHRYRPPDEFVAAVLTCPEQSSEAYVELLLPFAEVWRLDEHGVRAIAARGIEIREDEKKRPKSYLPG
jgi:hypothetical protein